MVDEGPDGFDRRFGKRLKVPVTVRVRVGDGAEAVSNVRDVNARGLGLESVPGAREGDRLAIEFAGAPTAGSSGVVSPIMGTSGTGPSSTSTSFRASAGVVYRFGGP